MRYIDKYKEMEFHLNQMEKYFRNADNNYIHSFNAFLASAQSAIFCLNKEYNNCVMYDKWKIHAQVGCQWKQRFLKIYVM